MNTILTTKKVITVTVGAAAVALAGSGCTAVTSGVAMPDRSGVEVTSTAADIDALGCAEVDGQKVDIPALSTTEPQLRVPQPDGWALDTEFDPESPELRSTLVSPSSITGADPEQMIVVAVEEMATSDTEAILEGGHAATIDALESYGLPTDVAVSSGTVCGMPAEVFTYEDAAAPAEAPPFTHVNAVANTCGRAYLVVVLSVGSYGSSVYQRDAEMILDGIEVLPAADAEI